MKHLYTGGVLAALLAVAAPASANNLIVNGGFEQTDNGYSETARRSAGLTSATRTG